MNEKRNEQAYQKVISEAYNKGNLAVLNQMLAAGFVEHQAGIVPPTLEGVKSSIQALRTAFPDLTVTVDDLVANGDQIWARLTARGTQQGSFAGIEPTGKAFSIAVFDLCRFENAQIAEHWGVADQFALVMQLRSETTATTETLAMSTAGGPAPTPPVDWI